MIRNYIKLFRVLQWIKNLFVFVPLLFSKHLFEHDYFLQVLGGFLIFSLASSIVYIINDIIDIESDRAHPTKQNRPLPSGRITVKSALIAAVILLSALAFLVRYFNNEFILSVAAFITLNVLYSVKLKNLVILDVFSIAAGFMIRVIAGALIINVEISSWLILTTMFLSLFLGIMKRYSELNLAIENGSATRKVLADYTEQFAMHVATIAAAAVIICYALYTVAERTVNVFGTEHMIYTTPIVVFGIFRYMFLVYLHRQGENTSEIMVTDIPMILTVIAYIFATVLIVYRIF